MERLISQFKDLHECPDDWSVQRYARHALRISLWLWAVVTVLCILGGLALGNPKKPFGEAQPYTFYSTFVLGTCAVVCWHCSQAAANQGRGLWRLMAVGFAFLAADDLLQIHENIDKLIHFLAGADAQNFITKHLDDFIVLAYGLAGAFFLYKRRKDLLNLQYFLKGVTWAGVFFVVMVIFDVTDGIALGEIAGTIVEESFKVLTGTILFWTFVTARLQLRRNQPAPTVQPTTAPAP